MNSDGNSQPAAVELRDLTKRFNGRPILSAVDLSIAAGESLVLLGSSGSGKSVLLRQIMGLERPDIGTVMVDDADGDRWVNAFYCCVITLTT